MKWYIKSLRKKEIILSTCALNFLLFQKEFLITLSSESYNLMTCLSRRWWQTLIRKHGQFFSEWKACRLQTKCSKYVKNISGIGMQYEHKTQFPSFPHCLLPWKSQIFSKKTRGIITSKYYRKESAVPGKMHRKYDPGLLLGVDAR